MLFSSSLVACLVTLSLWSPVAANVQVWGPGGNQEDKPFRRRRGAAKTTKAGKKKCFDCDKNLCAALKVGDQCNFDTTTTVFNIPAGVHCDTPLSVSVDPVPGSGTDCTDQLTNLAVWNTNDKAGTLICIGARPFIQTIEDIKVGGELKQLVTIEGATLLGGDNLEIPGLGPTPPYFIYIDCGLISVQSSDCVDNGDDLVCTGAGQIVKLEGTYTDICALTA